MNNDVAKYLLETKAVHLEPKEENFFTWTSGIKSPIYCDNRQLISYPEARAKITASFCDLIREKFTGVELIAGTATAGIPWAAWISEALNLPMVYIRSKPKGHGMKSAIEGKISKSQKTLIIEDLISTGKSSIEAYHHAQNDELNVLSVLSIFTYDLNKAKLAFENESLTYHSLCNLESLLGYAESENLLSNKDTQMIKDWKESNLK